MRLNHVVNRALLPARATLPWCMWMLSSFGCLSLSDAVSFCTPAPYFDWHEHAVCPVDAAAPIRHTTPLDSGWLKGDACHSLGSSQFCTFTHPRFNRGLGIALITTDAILKDLSSSSTLREADTKTAGSAAVPPYEAKQLPGKGVGLVATRYIRQGELLIARTPAVMVDGVAFNSLSTAYLTEALAHAITSLPPLHQHEYLQLSTHDGATTYQDKVYKVFATNNFRTRLQGGKDFHSTFTQVSRLNHDCRPNSGYYFDASTLSQKVFAARDIHAGEELSIAYYDPIQNRAARQHQLRSHWGFNCTCKHCSSDPDLIAESDRRVGQIHALWKHLDDYSPAAGDRTDKAEQLIELYQLEHLETRIHEAYYRAAIEWNGVGDSASAIEAAKRCLDRGGLMRGPSAPFAKNMRDLIQDPKKHWSWKFRIADANEHGHY